jgi:hypothetical protein
MPSSGVSKPAQKNEGSQNGLILLRWKFISILRRETIPQGVYPVNPQDPNIVTA